GASSPPRPPDESPRGGAAASRGPARSARASTHARASAGSGSQMTSPSTYVGPSALFRLLWGGLRLKYGVYSEVRQHPDSLRLCLAVTILAGAAYGVRLAVFSGLSPALLALDRILIVIGQLLLESAFVWAV